MRLLILILFYFILLGQISAQSRDSINTILPDTNQSKDNIGIYFRIPFYPQGTVCKDPVDELPKFPGGEDSLQVFISRNLKLPKIYSKSNLNGIVWIPIIVMHNGEAVFDGGVYCEPEFEDEAYRLTQLMPKWEPAKLNNENVTRDIAIPIYYSKP